MEIQINFGKIHCVHNTTILLSWFTEYCVMALYSSFNSPIVTVYTNQSGCSVLCPYVRVTLPYAIIIVVISLSNSKQVGMCACLQE